MDRQINYGSLAQMQCNAVASAVPMRLVCRMKVKFLRWMSGGSTLGQKLRSFTRLAWKFDLVLVLEESFSEESLL